MANFALSVSASCGMLGGLLAVAVCAPMLPNHGAARFVREIVAEARGRNVINWLPFRSATTGYYESLLSAGRPGWGGLGSDIYASDPFLVWKPMPKLRFVDETEGPVHTNSCGFFDHERSFIKPPGVRRVALLGDSIARGFGVRMDARFDRVLQQSLNAANGGRLEILNFAVSGFRITQMLDVAANTAALFHPDIYMVVVTEGVVGPGWGLHLGALAAAGADLKYDFLRKAVAASGLRSDDDGPTAAAKLAPYRLPVLRGALAQLKGLAVRDAGRLIVVFVSSAEPAELIRPHFQGLRQVIEADGIPVVDLLDTFGAEPDLERLRVAWFDLHPNAEGHRMIAANLYHKLRARPDLWELFSAR